MENVSCDWIRKIAVGSKVIYGDGKINSERVAVDGMHDVYRVSSNGVRDALLICHSSCSAKKVLKKIFSAEHERVLSPDPPITCGIFRSTNLSTVRLPADWNSATELFSPRNGCVFAWMFGFETKNNSLQVDMKDVRRREWFSSDRLICEKMDDFENVSKVSFESNFGSVYKKARPGSYSAYRIRAVSEFRISSETFYVIAHSELRIELIAELFVKRMMAFGNDEKISCPIQTGKFGSGKFERLTARIGNGRLPLTLNGSTCNVYSMTEPESEECFAFAIGKYRAHFNLGHPGLLPSLKREFSSLLKKTCDLRELARSSIRNHIDRSCLNGIGLPKMMREFMKTDPEPAVTFAI